MKFNAHKVHKMKSAVANVLSKTNYVSTQSEPSLLLQV